MNTGEMLGAVVFGIVLCVGLITTLYWTIWGVNWLWDRIVLSTTCWHCGENVLFRDPKAKPLVGSQWKKRK